MNLYKCEIKKVRYINKTKKAVLYIRVSTEEQAKHGYSIQAQIDDCSNFAKKEGFDVVEIFADEGYSAKDLNRPKIQELFAFCGKKSNNIQAIIVWKLDRFSRSTEDYHGFINPFCIKNSLSLLSVIEGNGDSITDELARNIYISFAEFERKNIALRVNVGMKAKAEKGIYPSRAPIGYKNYVNEHGERIILVDETRALFIRRTFELYSTGAYTVESLRKLLANEGFRNKTSQITKKGIYTILKNPFYIGTFIWKGVTYNNAQHKPLITKELYYRVQAVFEKKSNPRLQKHDFVYTSLIKCECGCFLTAEIHKERLIYYKCTGNKGCTYKKKYIREEIIEAKYQEIFDSINLPIEFAEKIAKEIKKVYKEFSSNDELSIEALSKEIPKIEKKLNQLYEDKLEGIIDIEFFKKKQNDYQSQIDKIKIQIDKKLKTSQERFDYAQDLIELCKEASSLFKQASNIKKRMLINLVQSNAILKDEKLLVELKSVFYELAKNANIDKWYPQGKSNPCRLREREVS